jgi:Protein of unknown function (DUF2442)
MNPRIAAVAATDDHRLRLTFTSGEVGIYDCAPLLKFGVFAEVADICYFKRAYVENGTVVWPHEQDICPDTLYEDSTKVASPSAEHGNVQGRADGPVSSSKPATPSE